MPRKTIHSPGGAPEPIRYLPVINDATSAAPPGAAMRIVSIDEDGFAHISQPNKFGQADDIIFNSLVTLPSGSEGTGTKDLPAIAAYSVVGGGAGGTGIPDEGEVWGTTPNSWFLSENACGNGFKILGGAGDGLVNVEKADNKPFFARILTRTSSSCGNSGSGSGDTDHTLYTYTVHSVRFIDDGDGCPTAINDEIDVAITGTAYEVNNRRVAKGTIVEVESVTYTDEQVSGSGTNTTGPAGCRLVFAHEATEPTSSEVSSESSLTNRYFCVDGLLKEYIHDGAGGYRFVRNTGACCNCVGSGSGAGAGSGGSGNEAVGDACCTPPDVICLSLSMSACTGAPHWVSRLNGYTLQLTRQTAPNDTSYWFAATNSLGMAAYILKHENPDGTCTWEFRADINRLVLGGGPAADDGLRISGIASAISCSPFSMTFATLDVTVYLTTGGLANCSASATVAAGECGTAPASGSGGAGGCPCQWQWTGTPALGAWGLIYQSGKCVCGTMPRTNGSYDGEIRNTECDGSSCASTDDDPDAGVDCSACGTAARTAAYSSQTGFMSGVDMSTQTTLSFVSNCTWTGTTGQTFACGLLRVDMWCESGRWYMTLSGSGTAFARTISTGSLGQGTYTLSYSTDNTLCPGQSGSVTVTVT